MKGIREYKQSQGKPKWKALLRGFISNTQAQVTNEGEGAKMKVEGQEKSLKKKLDNFN
jgi:hypothetical protein